VTLAAGQGIAVFAPQELGHLFVEGVLLVGGTEGPGDRLALGVADVLGDLVAQGPLAECRKPLAQGAQVAAGARILRAEGIDIAEEVLVDQG